MKKSTKGYVKAAFTCTIVGAAFCIASLCMGFQPRQLQAMVESGELNIAGPDSWQKNVEEAVTDITSEGSDFSAVFSDVKSLDLESGTAICKLYLTDEEDWRVEARHVPSHFNAEKHGNTLEVECKSKRWGLFNWNFLRSNESSTAPVIEIYIPRTVSLKELSIEAGVGEVTMEDGPLTCRELDVDCGVGTCTLDLDIQKKADIECGVGELNLNVVGSPEDFNYDIECGVGEIEIDGTHHSGLGNEQTINNHASKSMDIECGVGSVFIEFTE